MMSKWVKLNNKLRTCCLLASSFLNGWNWIPIESIWIYTSLVYSLGRCRQHFPCLAPICRALILKNDTFGKVRFFPNMALLSISSEISGVVIHLKRNVTLHRKTHEDPLKREAKGLQVLVSSFVFQGLYPDFALHPLKTNMTIEKRP